MNTLKNCCDNYFNEIQFINEDRNKKQLEDQEKTNSEEKKLKRCDPCDIFIADFPKYFIEIDLSNLFLEYGIKISNIHLHNGIHPYAFGGVHKLREQDLGQFLHPPSPL